LFSFASERFTILMGSDSGSRAKFYSDCVDLAESYGQLLLAQQVYLLKN